MLRSSLKNVLERLRHSADAVTPGTSASHYNKGLAAKYAGRWRESLLENQRSVKIDPTNEAGWWNLGIAATALRDWKEALRAWHALHISFEVEAPEPLWKPSMSCVRVDPDGKAEVVWGDRIDPARMIIQNVPLPESGRRFRDVVLNDGAQMGTRTARGYDYPVFNELEILHVSEYSTYELHVVNASAADIERLHDACEEQDIGMEDWSTLRILCAKCSMGNPDEHICEKQEATDRGERRLGLAATDRALLESVVDAWGESSPHIGIFNMELVLDAQASCPPPYEE